MLLKDARLFVACFVKGKYTPEEYANFLNWLQDASIDELGIIADEHEALSEEWSLAKVGPSAEWVRQLEHKLDLAERLPGGGSDCRLDSDKVVQYHQVFGEAMA